MVTWTILPMSLLRFWTWERCSCVVVYGGSESSRISYLNLCSKDERRSYRFETTWGWVINYRISIFGWTIPLTLYFTVLLKNIVLMVCVLIQRSSLYYSICRSKSTLKLYWNTTHFLTHCILHIFIEQNSSICTWGMCLYSIYHCIYSESTVCL